MHQSPLVTIFKVFDEEIYREYYMLIPEISQNLKGNEDKMEYLNRLESWIDLGIHPNIVQGLGVYSFIYICK